MLYVCVLNIYVECRCMIGSYAAKSLTKNSQASFREEQALTLALCWTQSVALGKIFLQTSFLPLYTYTTVDADSISTYTFSFDC